MTSKTSPGEPKSPDKRRKSRLEYANDLADTSLFVHLVGALVHQIGRAHV